MFALFYFVFEGKFQVQAPRGAYIRRGDLTEGFLHDDFEGLTFGGAYFRNITVSLFLLRRIARQIGKRCCPVMQNGHCRQEPITCCRLTFPIISTT